MIYSYVKDRMQQLITSKNDYGVNVKKGMLCTYVFRNMFNTTCNKKNTTVVYLHMTLSCFFQRRYISGTMQNIYCCAYFRLLSVHLRLLQDLLPILEKVVRGIPLPRYWIILNQI